MYQTATLITPQRAKTARHKLQIADSVPVRWFGCPKPTVDRETRFEIRNVSGLQVEGRYFQLKAGRRETVKMTPSDNRATMCLTKVRASISRASCPGGCWWVFAGVNCHSRMAGKMSLGIRVCSSFIRQQLGEGKVVAAIVVLE